MKNLSKLAALMPLLISLTPATASAKDDDIIVTGKTTDSAEASAAGAGFKTTDIDVGPLGNKTWIDTPYSSTTVTKEMIKNQQAKSVSELLKYSPSTQMQARGGMDVGASAKPRYAGQRGSEQPP